MKLYVYDHCPYCVKARMIFGLKNVKFDLIFLLNDDEETPISMVGKKVVPILKKDDGKFMPESMDIVAFIDQNFGGKAILTKNSTKLESKKIEEALNSWLNTTKELVYFLAMPRWVQADLPEFKTQSARDYFKNKKEAYIGNFNEHLAKSAEYLDKMNQYLRDLDVALASHFTPSNMDNSSIQEVDFHLFAALHSLSIVKGLIYPQKVQNYRQKLSALSQVNLHDRLAI